MIDFTNELKFGFGCMRMPVLKKDDPTSLYCL